MLNPSRLYRFYLHIIINIPLHHQVFRPELWHWWIILEE